MQNKLNLIANKAKQDKRTKFTSLIHHINETNLHSCYHELNKDKACGIDGVTLEAYGEALTENITLLVQKLKSKRYRPKPVRRVYIPKAGKDEYRGLGIPALEDKLVQLMVKKILEPIFESNFLDCSYGFRPNLDCHKAISYLDQTIMKEPVNYVVEVDVRKFFDKVDHSWLIKCLEERIADPNMLWLINRLLKSGVIESGEYHHSLEGAPQGGIASPLLANIYLHYVLDLWFTKVIKPKARGMMKLIRYCDDFLVCCENRKDAEEFLSLLQERLKKFNLEIAEEKTKIIKFGRQAWKQWRKGGNKPESFDFLGFTHYCKTSRNGWFSAGHKISKANLRKKLLEIKLWLKKIHGIISTQEMWKVLKVKLLGHYRYFGVSGNYRCLRQFYYQVISLVFKWINRRSQRKSMNWQKYLNYLSWNPLPIPRIYHQLYSTPSNIGNAIPKSPVWENHSQGSVRASMAMKQNLTIKE